MRPNLMTRFAALALAAALSFAAPSALHAQESVGGPGDTLKDTTILKLPAGAHAAIYDWEDLECPACARAFPITHEAVEHYKIPLIRHDFLIPGHPWSPDAAVTARYLQDKVSPNMAEQFRRDVFANQMSLGGREDLQNFSRKWFADHKLAMPFAMDPSGRFAAEVQADVTLGNRIGLQHTPLIIVVGPHGYVQVADITRLYSVLDNVLAESASKPAVRKTAAKH